MPRTNNVMVIPGHERLVNRTLYQRVEDYYYYWLYRSEGCSQKTSTDKWTKIEVYPEMIDGSMTAFLTTVEIPKEEPSKANQASVEEILKPEPDLASFADDIAKAIRASMESYNRKTDVKLANLIDYRVIDSKDNQVDLGTGEGRNLCWAFCLSKCPAFEFLLDMTQDDLQDRYGFKVGDAQDIVQAARVIVKKTPEKFKDFKLEILIRQPGNQSWTCETVTAPGCETIKLHRLFLQITGDQHSAHYTWFNEEIYLEPSVIVRF